MSIITELAEKLGQELTSDERYLKYQELKVRQTKDSALQEKIGEFNLKRVSLSNEMQKDDRDEDRVSEIQGSMEALYKEIMETPSMAEFNEASRDFEELVNSVYSIINYHITGEQPSSCGGSCSGCGGSCGH